MDVDVTFNINSVESQLDNQNYRQNFANLKEYADDCAMSRHRDGMHYKFSLEPGSWICTVAVANGFTLKLWRITQIFVDE